VTDAATPALLERLASDDRATQRRACGEASERMSREPELRDGVLRLLREGAPHARFAAAFALFPSEPGLRLLPALLDALELEDGDQRWAATHLLTTLGTRQGEVLPVLLHEAREAASPRRRRMSLYAVRELAPGSPEVAATLLAALDDGDGDVRRAALSSLAKLADPDPACLERVLGTLRDDPDPRMRRIAAVALPALVGSDPERAALARDLLARAGAEADPALARAASLALRRLDDAFGAAC
jgi:HEAT repeat protein